MSDEAPAKKRRGCGFWLLCGLGILIVLAIAGSLSDRPVAGTATGSIDSTSKVAEVPAKETEEANSPDITAAEFAALRTGMSYEEAVKVIGGPGELQSESEVAGYRTVMYTWKSGFMGANANAMFQNGKLVSKAQFGLH